MLLFFASTCMFESRLHLPRAKPFRRSHHMIATSTSRRSCTIDYYLERVTVRTLFLAGQLLRLRSNSCLHIRRWRSRCRYRPEAMSSRTLCSDCNRGLRRVRLRTVFEYSKSITNLQHLSKVYALGLVQVFSFSASPPFPKCTNDHFS